MRLSVPNQIKPPSTSSLTAFLETGQSSTEIKTNKEKNYRSTFEVSQVLVNECGTEFQGANNTFVECLKRYKIRSDASAVKFPKYLEWKERYNAGSWTSQELLQEILNRWVDCNVPETKIEHLINVLKAQGSMHAAGNNNHRNKH